VSSTNILELDFSNKLEIRINNQRPIVLTDLTMALLGVANQYEKFVENAIDDGAQPGSELYIKEVRSGSIIVELVAHAIPMVPLLWQGGALIEWANQARDVVLWLTAKLDNPPKEMAKQDLKQWQNILEPIAKDHGSQMNISVSDHGQVIQQFIINSEQANIAQNGIRRELEKLEEPDDHVLKKLVMVWYQTKFDDHSPTGDKAVIEKVTKTPLKVVFENNAVKKAMLAGDSRFAKPWHELAYLVDIRMQTINGVPKVYTIINYHIEDTFDPNE
jgi:hypothetical protein